MLRRIGTLVRELKEISDNVAHDLRSPITRMRGAAETTLTGPQELEAYREMGITIIEESDRLTGMINTMLEIAQSESGVLEISRAPVDLTALLKNAAELFQPVAEEKRIHLSAELPKIPLIISGDKNRLQRVAANLLDNAIKYTPDGGAVRLICRAVPGGAEVELRDTGTGIEPEELPRIFDRFYRGEKSRSSCGNGLGLSLAQSIIQSHGGWIAVESRPGKGSVFKLFLPRSGR
jgi:signal transduction histidine kinase